MIARLLHADQWVRVRNFMNPRFPAASPCSICLRAACEMVWYSIRTGEVKCMRCFTPEVAS
jgi:hypothetical protein